MGSKTGTGYGDNEVTFSLNGKVQRVSALPGDMSLVTYIREHAHLKGTKFMCRAGGCGACVVSIQLTHPSTGLQKTVSVNSCLFPLYACHGYKVTTVEGIGSKKDGYHDIQSRLAHFSGTQCGYCSPGWVMAMYSLLQENPKATMTEIENAFSGNLCRCTGYRPILDAFKSFASDTSRELQQKVVDIEELLKVCPKSGVICHAKCKQEKSQQAPFDCVPKAGNDDCEIDFVEVALASPNIKISLPGETKWYKVTNVDEIYQILMEITSNENEYQYRLVAGNTSNGVFPGEKLPLVCIDINGVGFLQSHTMYDNHLYIGANTTLADTIVLFRAVAMEYPQSFSYLKELAMHLEKVANTHVRNVGTLAGNLKIKHEHREFPSDIYLILEVAGATISIRSDNEAITIYSMTAFLEIKSMYRKVCLQIIFPPIEESSHVVRTFKITPRAQNALAYVNAGFNLKVNKQDKFRVIEPSIVFGGIHKTFLHAYGTENYIRGKQLLDESVLQGALQQLGREVNPDSNPTDPEPDYRRALCQALFYRVTLSLNAESVTPRYRSGGENLTRELSSGKQEYGTHSKQEPLYQPFPKMDAVKQCSGEAEYAYDKPKIGNDDLFAAFVISKHGPAILDGLDATLALKVPGVVAFFSAKDIPGKNTFTPHHLFIPDDEKLFAEGEILHAGQQCGVVVAETQDIAYRAAAMVVIKYKHKKKPVLDVREVVKSNDTSRIFFRIEKPAISQNPLLVKKKVKGEFKMDSQYHFAMENLSCVTVPTEDGIDVCVTTQWPQSAAETCALILNIPVNSINIQVRRIGGSYGGKLTRGNLVAGACSLAAYLLQRPVRMWVSLETVMEAIGKRYPFYFKYEAGLGPLGDIHYLNINTYSDAGSAFNDGVILPFLFSSCSNVYKSLSWNIKMHDVKTDKPCNIWCRSPGTLEGITMAEHIMEHIAHELKEDPLAVRLKNLDLTDQIRIREMVYLIKEKSDYEARKTAVDEFNKKNVWKKRGVSMVPMKFPLDTLGNYHASVSVYRHDGTVTICHGGIEIGQGINTKAAQVCASVLGIPLDKIVVRPSNSHSTPNDGPTAGSFTSESVCHAVDVCCNELNARLAPIRLGLVAPSWVTLIQAAYIAQIDLHTSYMMNPIKEFKRYHICGVTVVDVEVDILTGEIKIPRVDILEDAGQSLNPLLDIGQVEGAFVMGLGYFTSERLIYDENTGQLLTNRTLKYEIPGAKDIPRDFRVYLMKNSFNPLGFLRTKAVGEPPLCMSNAIMFAIRHAMSSARKDLGLLDSWIEMDAPFTAENIVLSAGIGMEHYHL